MSGQLQDAVMNMREDLADLCGLPVDADLELVRPDGGVTGVSLDTEAALSAAYTHNPEIEAAAHQLEKARAALRAAHAEYIPDVGAFAQHIYQDGAPFLSRNNGAFGVHMTWTMFEFGKRRGQVSERSAEIAQAEENLARLKNRVRIDVEKAIRKLNRAETGVNSARELVAGDNRSAARVERSGGDWDCESLRLPGFGGLDVQRTGRTVASGVRPQRGGRGPYAAYRKPINTRRRRAPISNLFFF